MPALAGFICISLILNGCRTAASLTPVNLTEPGWRVREGQALWSPSRRAGEMAGDLIVATSSRREAVVQFTKTPLPIVLARWTPGGWAVDFQMEHRTLQGRGAVPWRIVWLLLAEHYATGAAPKGWRLEQPAPQQWHWSNPKTGESLEIYLPP